MISKTYNRKTLKTLENTSHIIQKMLFNVQLQDAGNAKEMEILVNELLQNKLQSELDVVLTEHSELAEYICFDKIEIDLGSIDIQTSDEELVHKIIAQLSMCLKELTHSTTGQFKIKKSKSAPIVNHSPYKETLGQRALSQFLFFLKNGFFPWNAITSNLAELEQLVLEQINTNKAIKKTLIQSLKVSPNSLRRMAMQTSEHFYLAFLDVFKLQPSHYQQCLQHVRYIDLVSHHIVIPPSAFREIYLSSTIHSKTYKEGKEEKMIEHFLHKIATDNGLTTMDIVQHGIETIGTTKSIKPSILPDSNSQPDQTLKLLKTIKSRYPEGQSDKQPSETRTDTPKTPPMDFNENTQSIIIREDDIQKRLNTLIGKHLKTNPTPELEDLEGNAFNKRSTSSHTPPPLSDDFDEIFVADAGIAIIHPFLPSLFKNLGLVNSNGFIDPTGRLKAIKLLGYICSGAESISENRLTIAKLLCGIDLQTSVEQEISLSAAEKMEVEQMLHSVIGHWTILKNTSIGTFRESFINRSGILKHNTNEWLLSIEHRPFDVLFNYIPWNISMIYYSWMPSMMKVTISNTKT